MYDLIGDIHGHADALEALLQLMGYTEQAGVYRHPERQVIFLGDFIDRGPKIRRVLDIARSMVDAGVAQAVLGNHEMNALAFQTPDVLAPGKYLRRHFGRNISQHQATLDQINPTDWQTYLAWFRTLPFALELDGLRAVHACWDEDHLHALHEFRGAKPITDAFLGEAYRKQGLLYQAVEDVLKGKELALPDGHAYHDAEGNRRTDVRVRWYQSPVGQTYASYAFQHEPVTCDVPLNDAVVSQARPYSATAKPVFIGHYWLRGASPYLLAPNVACLDFSVAKNGYLCAYRWQGEHVLDASHFAWVRSS